MVCWHFYVHVLCYTIIRGTHIASSSNIKPLPEDKCNFDCTTNKMFDELSKLIPPKIDEEPKGYEGIIGLIGGSSVYTGSPYFAAITALKVGCDKVDVITTKSAAVDIKCYSPDLIVHPYLCPKCLCYIRSLISRLNVIVMGPGLGRENETMNMVYDIIDICRSLGKPLVIDADAIYAVSKKPSILKGYPCPGVIITSNQKETMRLMNAIPNKDGDWYRYWGDCVSVLVKGEDDYFYSNTSGYVWVNAEGGSGRRVGGQGAVLSGALGTFYNWALNAELCKNKKNTQLAQAAAAYAASKFTRLCNYKAFSTLGHNMLVSDMIREIHSAFVTLFTKNDNKCV